MKGNLHISLTNFLHENRVLRETQAIADNGLSPRIYIAARWEKGLQETELIDGKREVWRVPICSLPKLPIFKPFKFAEFAFKVLRKYGKKVDIVNCHSIISLPMGFLFKLLFGAKLVYDPHELETEVHGLGRFRKKMCKIMERCLIPTADAVIVVSDGIGAWYRAAFPLAKVSVVKNIPLFKEPKALTNNKFRSKYSLKPDDIIFIYQGSLEVGRGIDIMLETFSEIKGNKHIIFMGFGTLENLVKDYSERFHNIHFHPPVRPHELMEFTQSADIGICLTEDSCLNHYYSLPNKIFEYVFSGLPAIGSDFPEIANFLDQNDCGWKVAVQKAAVAELISNLSAAEIKRKKKQALKCRKNINWETEKQKIIQIYQDLNHS